MKTLRRAVTVEGRGLHTGAGVRVTLRPREAPGVRFVRADLPGRPGVEASPGARVSSERCTMLRAGQAEVSTVEHLLAALQGADVVGAEIEVEGPELPILDGSALPWLRALAPALAPAAGPPRPAIREPIFAREGRAFAAAMPHDGLRLSYHIEFPYPIGDQWLTVDLDTPGAFERELAPARTFAFEREIEALRARGLAQGGDLGCALVAGAGGWLNPPLRFGDEPVRHKALDLLGDLGLLGVIPLGHYIAHRAGHRLHGALATAVGSALGG